MLVQYYSYKSSSSGYICEGEFAIEHPDNTTITESQAAEYITEIITTSAKEEGLTWDVKNITLILTKLP